MGSSLLLHMKNMMRMETMMIIRRAIMMIIIKVESPVSATKEFLGSLDFGEIVDFIKIPKFSSKIPPEGYNCGLGVVGGVKRNVVVGGVPSVTFIVVVVGGGGGGVRTMTTGGGGGAGGSSSL